MKVALILAGGFGTRLWPLSRKDFPKQFAKIISETSTYQQSLRRAKLMADKIVVVTSNLYKYLAVGQAKEIDVNLDEDDLILEPERRNTAPAIYYSLLRISERFGPESIVVILPSDHVIMNDSELLKAYMKSLDVANDRVALIGVPPSKPEGGLGYIKPGKEIMEGVMEVEMFKEKPGQDDAINMLKEGNWVWNTMIMTFRASKMMDLIEKTLPSVADPLRKFELNEAYKYVQEIDVSSGTLSKVPENLAVVVARDLGWSDLGSFESVYELLQKDSEGNARSGKVRYHGARNNLILSKRLVALVNVNDMIVIDDEDAILVMPKGSGQDLKELVESMLKEELPEVIEHRVKYEEWGTKTILLTGENYEVSKLKIYPGRSLGPKRHFHRSIYWQILSGTAKVILNGKESIIARGEGIRIPLGLPHSIINVGKIPLEVIEIATGEYLGSNDVEFLKSFPSILG